MKAIIHTQYGPPAVAKLQEVPDPIPKAHEVRIKVYSSTVNRTDSGFRSAEYFVSRFWSGLFKPKYPILGSEFSGMIDLIGSQVTQFKVGDRVFGYNDEQFGGHAEYVCIAEDKAIAHMPQTLDFYEAAAITEGAHYALNNIRASKIQSGENALVYGATGAIGSAAVQLLKYFGVHVTAVCNTKNIDLVQALGADVVIDYQTQDFTKTDTRFHLIFDAVGKRSFAQCKPLLTESGVYISTELGKNGENVFLGIAGAFSKGKRVLFPIPVMNKEITLFLQDLVEKGAFRPVIDCHYTMDQIVEAYTYVQTGQKSGNVVLRIVE